MHPKKNFLFILFCLFSLLLQSCANSQLSESQGTIESVYRTTSQTTKGAVIGGVTGGVIGGLNSGIGVVAGTITGAILGGALGAYLDAHSTVVDKLKSRGAKIFVLGDQVLIVLPSRLLFDGMTPNLRSSSYETLALVNQLVGQYANMSVQVAAYSNEDERPRSTRKLTQQQAEAVAKVLWRGGINTRLLYAAGYGGTKLVESNNPDCRMNWNDRIEITWEKLPT